MQKKLSVSLHAHVRGYHILLKANNFCFLPYYTSTLSSFIFQRIEILQHRRNRMLQHIQHTSFSTAMSQLSLEELDSVSEADRDTLAPLPPPNWGGPNPPSVSGPVSSASAPPPSYRSLMGPSAVPGVGYGPPGGSVGGGYSTETTSQYSSLPPPSLGGPPPPPGALVGVPPSGAQQGASAPSVHSGSGESDRRVCFQSLLCM